MVGLERTEEVGRKEYHPIKLRRLLKEMVVSQFGPRQGHSRAFQSTQAQTRRGEQGLRS